MLGTSACDPDLGYVLFFVPGLGVTRNLTNARSRPACIAHYSQSDAMLSWPNIAYFRACTALEKPDSQFPQATYQQQLVMITNFVKLLIRAFGPRPDRTA